ncbi:hypothetical protein GS538_25845 [Rhodococcus hoagii]|nr:hypothetical protein [Prescottella equi]
MNRAAPLADTAIPTDRARDTNATANAARSTPRSSGAGASGAVTAGALAGR